MITEFLVTAFSTLAAGLIGLLPSFTPPSWLPTAVSTLTDAVGYVSMLNGWVPIKAVGTAVAFMMLCSGLALLLKFGRMGLSLATGGGGSAA